VYLVNEYKLLKSEDLLKILKKVKNLNLKIWEVTEPRYQFNLKKEKNYLYNFIGKNVYIKEVENTEKFCFRKEYYIKRELHDELYKMLYEQVKLGNTKLDLNLQKEKDIIIYGNSIYTSIKLNKKFERTKVFAYFNNKYIIEIPPIGISKDGIPFSNDKIINESFSSAWWIQGTTVHIFINTKNFKNFSNIKIYINYSEKKD